MDSMRIMILGFLRSEGDDASPLWAILPAQMRDGFDNTIAIEGTGEHTKTPEYPEKEAPSLSIRRLTKGENHERVMPP